MNRTLKLTEDGRIDLAALDEWPTGDLREWLLARLNGDDPLWPLDHENFETPESLFIWLWRDAKPGSDFVATLGQACDELLHEAWGRRPQPWLRPLLRLVATIRPEACHQFLNCTVYHHEFSEELRAQDLDRAWLVTLAAYGRQAPDLVRAWLDLLQDDRYVDVAYDALSHSQDLAVWFLPDYYQALSQVERSVLMPEAVREIVGRDWDSARRSLARYRWRFDAVEGLCQAVDAALKELHYPTVFDDAAAPTTSPPPSREDRSADWNGARVLSGIAEVSSSPLAEVP